jgi:outer membrane protein assembly factor BamB
MMPALKLTVCLMAIATTACADDWPQWRGPDRTDVSQETGLLEEWPRGGPQQLWVYKNAGLGYSGPAVVGDRLYTLGDRDGQTYLIALKVSDGSEQWSALMGESFTNAWGHGPRCTPTVDGDLVFAISAKGDLVCASVGDGNIKWRANLVDDFGGGIPQWGYCESVLVDGEHVICTPGGSLGALVALAKKTGTVVWQSQECTEPAQYASLVSVDHGGRRQYIQLFMKKLVSVSADNGELLWEIDFPGKVAVVPTPIVKDSRVFVCAGYGVGGMLVDFSSGEPQEVYSNKVMKNHHGGVILVGEHLYGYSDKVGWVCQEFNTGKAIWRQRRKLGKGAIGYADGHFYCLDEESGEVKLIDASSKGWKERGEFVLEPQTNLRKPQGRIWTHPVIANGRLYLRDQELLYCYDLSK